MANDKSNHYLQPWSIISDAELARLRKLELVAKARIRHLLNDPGLAGYGDVNGAFDFSRAELEALIR